MVTTEPHEAPGRQDPVQLNIVTRGGATTSEDMNNKTCADRQAKAKIKKAVEAPVKFYVVHKKQFLRDAQRAVEEARVTNKHVW